MFNCDIYDRVIVGFIMKNFIIWDVILGVVIFYFFTRFCSYKYRV